VDDRIVDRGRCAAPIRWAVCCGHADPSPSMDGPRGPAVSPVTPVVRRRVARCKSVSFPPREHRGARWRRPRRPGGYHNGDREKVGSTQLFAPNPR
jgi:hypothetical protein